MPRTHYQLPSEAMLRAASLTQLRRVCYDMTIWTPAVFTCTTGAMPCHPLQCTLQRGLTQQATSNNRRRDVPHWQPDLSAAHVCMDLVDGCCMLQYHGRVQADSCWCMRPSRTHVPHTHERTLCTCITCGVHFAAQRYCYSKQANPSRTLQ